MQYHSQGKFILLSRPFFGLIAHAEKAIGENYIETNIPNFYPMPNPLQGMYILDVKTNNGQDGLKVTKN